MLPVKFDPTAGTEMPLITKDYPESTKPRRFPCTNESGRPIQSLRFKLCTFINVYGQAISRPNGSRLGRTQFTCGSWLVTIDRLPDANESYQEINQKGEHKYTHEGHLQQIDGSEFEWSNAKDFLDYLEFFFSYLCESYRAPESLIGFDTEGAILFVRDSFPMREVPASIQSTFASDTHFNLELLAQSMYAWWTDAMNNPKLHFIVRLICESTIVGMPEDIKIVLRQVLLEFLGNLILKEAWSDKSKRTASSQMTEVLRAIGVDTQVDAAQLSTLENFCQKCGSGSSKPLNGPEAITRIRNKVMHADSEKLKQVFNTSPLVKNEAADLALFYIEMLSLWLFGYDGQYSSVVNGYTSSAATPWPKGGIRPGSSRP